MNNVTGLSEESLKVIQPYLDNMVENQERLHSITEGVLGNITIPVDVKKIATIGYIQETIDKSCMIYPQFILYIPNIVDGKTKLERIAVEREGVVDE